MNEGSEIQPAAPPADRSLSGRSVVVIGGSAGIGLATARRAREAGAEVTLTGRDPERLERASQDVDARRWSAFDAYDLERLGAFFQELPVPVDHVMVTAGAPYYGRLEAMDVTAAGQHLAAHLALALAVGKASADRVRPGGSLLFMGGTGARRPGAGLSVSAALTAALPAVVADLALELAPIRVNLLAAGFVDTPLSAALLGDALEERRAVLRASLPIMRVVQPEDVAALAVHVMVNTALTGATFDIDGGQQLI